MGLGGINMEFSNYLGIYAIWLMLSIPLFMAFVIGDIKKLTILGWVFILPVFPFVICIGIPSYILMIVANKLFIKEK